MNHIRRKIFTAERLTLEPIRKIHAKDLYEDLSNPNLYKYVQEVPPASLPELEKKFEYLEMRFGKYENEIHLDWIIKKKQTEEIIGMVQATIFENKKANIGYVITEKYWNNGFGSEAVNAILHFLLNNIKVIAIEAAVRKENIYSINLLKKAGFFLKKSTYAKKGNSTELILEYKINSHS